MQELWQPVYGLEDRFMVSNVGRVKCRQTGKIHRSQLLGGRYVAVNMNGGMQKVHHLVAEAFICPRPAGLLCLHKDDDRFNNTPENLYWGTDKQNHADIKRNGNRQNQSGQANPNAKLTPEQVKAIRAASGTCKAIGAQFGCSSMTVSLIKRRKLWAECD